MIKLVFDSGPIISFALNNMLFVLEKLHEKGNVEFIIPRSVEREIIEEPMRSKKFKYEAFQIRKLVEKGVINIYEKKLDYGELENLANNSFFVDDTSIKIIHPGELEVFILAKEINASAVVIDEASARLLIEHPNKILKRLENKLHKHVRMDYEKLNLIRKKINVKIIRSVELAVIAFERGYFDYLLPSDSYKQPRQDNENDNTLASMKAELLDAILWALKLNGCSLSEKEIYAIMNYEHNNGNLN